MAATGVIAPAQYCVTSTWVKGGNWHDNLVSRGIQLVTASPVNHALLCHHIDPDGTAWCLEARPSGVGWVKASAYPDAIWSAEVLTPAQVEGICAWALAHKGTKYGWLDCAAAGLDSLHDRFRWVPECDWAAEKLDSWHTMDCSQFVTMSYTFGAGLALVPDEKPSQVDPGDLYERLKAQGLVPLTLAA